MARKSYRYGAGHSQLATPGGIQAVWGQQGTWGPSAHRGGQAEHPVDTGYGEPHVGKEGQLETLFSLFFAVKM